MMNLNNDRSGKHVASEGSYRAQAADNHTAHPVSVARTVSSQSTARRILRAFLMALVAIAMVFSASLVAPHQAHAAIPSLPVHPNYDLKWYRVQQITPVWQQQLHTNSVYWSGTRGSMTGAEDIINDKDSSTEYDNTFPILGEMYNFNFNDTSVVTGQSYKTRAALSLRFHKPSGEANIVGATDDVRRFRSAFNQNAVGVYRGARDGYDSHGTETTSDDTKVTEKNPRSSLSVFFWSYLSLFESNQILDPSAVPCPENSNGCKSDGRTNMTSNNIIFRVDDGSNVLWAARFPGGGFVRDSSSASTRYMTTHDSELSGGQIDPRTGYLYIKSTIDYQDNMWLDARTVRDRHMNIGGIDGSRASQVQFLIWDPATGSYTFSREIQPRNLLQRSLYYLKAKAWKDPANRVLYSDDKADNYIGSGVAGSRRTGTCFPIPGDRRTPLGTNHDYCHTWNNGDYGGWYRPMKGFSLTANGDILLPVANAAVNGNESYHGETPNRDSSTSNDYTVTLLRISPLRDARGDFELPNYSYSSTDSVAQFPSTGNRSADALAQPSFPCWTYEVVTKFQAPSNMSWKTGAGPFFSATLYNNRFITLNQSALWNCRVNGTAMSSDMCATSYRAGDYGRWMRYWERMYPNILVVGDPQTSTLKLAQSADTGTHDVALDAARYETQQTNGTLSTPSISSTIAGIVRWDKAGTGTFTNDESSGLDPSTDPLYNRVEAADSKETPLVEGETLALYDGVGHLLQTTTTDSEGQYAFYPNIEEGSNSFIVRLVQPQVNMGSTNSDIKPEASGTKHVSSVLTAPDGERMKTGAQGMRNAVQSWALTNGITENVSSTRDESATYTHNLTAADESKVSVSVRAACLAPNTGAAVKNSSARKYEKCYGSKRAPYVDPNLTDVGDTVSTSNMPIYSTVNTTINSETVLFEAQADFGITAAGSYGDSAQPFNSQNDAKGPYLTGIDPNNLRLGASPALYTDGTTDDSHLTDDGVKTEKGSLKGLRPNKNGLVITVHGSQGQALSYRLVGWLVPKNGTHDDIEQVFSTKPQSIAADDSQKITVHFSDWKDSSGKAINLQPGTYLLRIMAVPEQLNTKDSDNKNGAYDGPAFGIGSADTQYWTNPGEIEDYVMTVNTQQAIIRFQTLIESKTGQTISLPQNVTYWPGGSGSTGRNPNFKTYSVGTANQFLPGIDAFDADSAMTLPQYVFEDAASRDYHFMTSNRLWYDANYENPNVPDAQKSTNRGMVCFEHDNPGDDEPGKRPLGTLVAAPTSSTAAPTFSVKKINQADRQDKTSQVQEGVDARIDHTNEWDITMRPRQLTNHEDVIVTCQVPLKPAVMVLPNTGSTAPWMLIIGSVLLLTALSGIATVLVLRRRN